MEGGRLVLVEETFSCGGVGRRSSGGQEGGWVVWGEGLGAEGGEVGVVGGGEGIDGLGGGGAWICPTPMEKALS